MSNSPSVMTAIEILLVEDSPTDRLIAMDALHRAKLANVVNTVENGVDALAYLRRQGKFSHAARPDLILLDLNLPGKDGRQVLAEIKEDAILKFIPVVVMTTSTEDADIVEAYGHHANGYITKPINIARFTQAVCALGNYWFEVVTLPVEAAIHRLAEVRPARISAQTPAGGHALHVTLVTVVAADEALVRNALQQPTRVPFELTTVGTAAALREHIVMERCDVVLATLEGDQGLASYRKIRAAAASLPIVVLSGASEQAAALGALAEGAEDYLIKEELTLALLERTLRYAAGKRSLEAELAQSQRREVFSQLARGVAHDFNNMLTVIHGHAGLLASGTIDVSRSAQEIVHAAEHATNLTRQLLTFARKHKSHMMALNLDEVVGSTTRLLRHVIGDQLRLELQLGGHVPAVHADKGMVEQVILNLALNARDAMLEGGKLTIGTSAVDVDAGAASRHASAYPGRFARLTIRDTGSGMPQEVLARIWEPFFTTKELGKGTGLGLAGVYSIMQQHRGWVEVQSKQGEGTSFELFFPSTTAQAEAAPEMRATPMTASETMSAGDETILLVEDNEALRNLASAVLKMRGYHILEARTALEALELWRKHAQRIDLLLTDIYMPDSLTGLQLAETLQRARPNLPAVFVSGYDIEMVASTRLAGLTEGHDFLQKPYTVAGLVATIRARLDGAAASRPTNG